MCPCGGWIGGGQQISQEVVVVVVVGLHFHSNLSGVSDSSGHIYGATAGQAKCHTHC